MAPSPINSTARVLCPALEGRAAYKYCGNSLSGTHNQRGSAPFAVCRPPPRHLSVNRSSPCSCQAVYDVWDGRARTCDARRRASKTHSPHITSTAQRIDFEMRIHNEFSTGVSTESSQQSTTKSVGCLIVIGLPSA